MPIPCMVSKVTIAQGLSPRKYKIACALQISDLLIFKLGSSITSQVRGLISGEDWEAAQGGRNGC